MKSELVLDKSIATQDGEVAAVLMPGSFFGERSILFDVPLDFHYQAYSTPKADGSKLSDDTHVYSIKKENF